MPVENEVKHVLSDPEGALMAELSARHTVADLDQFYVTPNNRFRTTRERAGDYFEVRRQHAFKLDIGGRLLEVETDVSEEDVRLAALAARERIVKRRISFEEDGTHWDVDFIYDFPADEGGSVRFVMAEAEFPEGGSYRLSPVIAPYLDFIVTKGFAVEFTNRNLADPAHVTRVMREVAPRLRSTTQLILERQGATLGNS